MIRFACPKCQKELTVADDKAGTKGPCPVCGIRLQVPMPRPNKTVLGSLVTDEPPSVEPSRPASAPSGQIVECPACKKRVNVPHASIGRWVECPYCREGFAAVADSPEEEIGQVEILPESAPDLKYCHECGAKIRTKAVVCPKCGVAQPAQREYRSVEDVDEYAGAGSNRIAAGIFGILLGGLGIHKFILGYTGAGIIMLLVSVIGVFGFFCVFGIPSFVMSLIGLIEGIIYLTKSDGDFYRDYVLNKRPWF
jgi:TM2 domain-containing membrane protein YozV/DNA-directed RNA polymerase subunit RPC12/RpoP